MTSTGKLLPLRVLIDVIALILVALPSLVFKVGDVQPFQRGFFCDDETIRYPYHPSTISTVTLIVVGGLLNIVAIVVCECVQYFFVCKRDSAFREKLCGRGVPPVLYTICGYVWILGFGMLFNQGITDVGKFSIGRLRPHFLDGCKPNVDYGNCKPGQYISNFTCTQTDKEIFHDLRLSFPSGHASLAAFTMIFFCIYVQARLPRSPCTYLYKNVLQFIAILMGWFTGLSRVTDYKHHWNDVLSGFIIGIIVAVYVTQKIANNFRDPYRSRFPYYKTDIMHLVNDVESRPLDKSRNAEEQSMSQLHP